jgi:hypothetical protein
MREARRLRDAYRALRTRQSSEDLLQGRVDDDAVALLNGTSTIAPRLRTLTLNPLNSTLVCSKRKHDDYFAFFSGAAASVEAARRRSRL